MLTGAGVAMIGNTMQGYGSLYTAGTVTNLTNTWNTIH